MIDNICDILKFPSIRLSVLNPSIKALTMPYRKKYNYVNWPVYFLLFFFVNRITNIIKVQMDSYRKVGWTWI